MFTLTVPLTDLRLARKIYVHLHRSFKVRAAGRDFVASRVSLHSFVSDAAIADKLRVPSRRYLHPI